MDPQRATAALPVNELGQWFEGVAGRIAAVLDRARTLHGDEGEERVLEALRWAVALHKGQVDKAKRPYLCHISEVAGNVIDVMERPSVAMLCAALLHDSLEDCETGLAAKAPSISTSTSPRELAIAALQATFGREVESLVLHLTNPSFEGLDDDALIKAYDEHFGEVMAAGEDAAILKICDFRANALELQNVKNTRTRSWLVQKYSQPLIRAIEFLEDRRPRGASFLADAYRAWIRDYADSNSPRFADYQHAAFEDWNSHERALALPDWKWDRLMFGYYGDMDTKWAIEPRDGVFHMWRIGALNRQLLSFRRQQGARVTVWLEPEFEAAGHAPSWEIVEHIATVWPRSDD